MAALNQVGSPSKKQERNGPRVGSKGCKKCHSPQSTKKFGAKGVVYHNQVAGISNLPGSSGRRVYIYLCSAGVHSQELVHARLVLYR